MEHISQQEYIKRLLDWSRQVKNSASQTTFQDKFISFESSIDDLEGHAVTHEEITELAERANALYLEFINANHETVRKEVTKRVPVGEHKLPPLPYAYDALQPYIDKEIMRLHHAEHHKSYVDGLNNAEKEMESARKKGDFDLIKHWEREAAFHGAGHYLHTIFWNVMSPKGGGSPKGTLADQIALDFGSFDMFKEHFSHAAKKVEAVGWAILVWAPRAGRLEILQAEKHQNLSQWDVIPILPLDVWEHAYYLQYKNKRDLYVDNWWNVVDWEHANTRFETAKQVNWKPY